MEDGAARLTSLGMSADSFFFIPNIVEHTTEAGSIGFDSSRPKKLLLLQMSIRRKARFARMIVASNNWTRLRRESGTSRRDAELTAVASLLHIYRCIADGCMAFVDMHDEVVMGQER